MLQLVPAKAGLRPGRAVIAVTGEGSMLELYHNDMSTCAQKVRVALGEKNLEMKRPSAESPHRRSASS
jgi:hypothetical protein